MIAAVQVDSDQVGRPSRAAAWSGAAICVLTVVAASSAVGLALGNDGVDREIWSLLPAVVPFGLVGGFIVARRPRNPVGWLLAATGLAFTFQQLAGHYAYYGLVTDPGSLPATPGAIWAQTWLPAVGLVAAFVLMPLYFPNGRLVSPRWRPVVWLAVCWLTVSAVLLALVPGDTHLAVGRGAGIVNPLAVEGVEPAAWLLDSVLPLAWLVLSAVGVVSLIPRFRRAHGEERQQVKCLAYALALVVLLFALAALASVSFPGDPLVTLLDAVSTVAPVLIPLAAAVAILRYRLYDVDLLINRTVVYAALSAAVIAIYVIVVGWLGAVLQARDSLGISLVAAGLVAVVFAPLRDRLQRWADRLLHGDRSDPYRALSLLGRRLEQAPAPDAVLPTIVGTVREALRLPYAAVELGSDGTFRTAAEQGSRPAYDARVYLPLVHGGEVVGRLALAPRDREGFAAADRRLLEDLARQIGAAVHATRLTREALQLSADLQRSRERLVTAREEERRRLGRDIHDGLGPRLAGLTMTVEAARDLIGTEPARAAALLQGMLEQTDTAVDELRRMAYLLRPPALDTLGLVDALRTHAAQLPGLLVDIDAPPELPALPAAVEVAAYRICVEALHNVARHAAATHCTVRITVDPDGVALEVLDNGHGITLNGAVGLGLSSMQERAAELGGTCRIERPEAGGTRVLAWLPCLAAPVPGR